MTIVRNRSNRYGAACSSFFLELEEIEIVSITYDFKDRSVVVTGGAQGIGFNIVKNFLEAGARVSIWDYSKEALKHCTSELAAHENTLHTACVDIGDFDAAQRAAATLPFTPHILVNNAGITRDKSFKKMTKEDFEAVIQINLIGAFNTTKCLLDIFDSNDSHKRIINVSSIVALYGSFGQANYAAAKAGLIGFTKTLARELGPKGFTVNALAPGFTETAMIKTVPKDYLDSLAKKVPVGRLGQTSDLANACLFLSSKEAEYINGITLNVDGGLVI
jgi:3-oxoacyl-[acyl-carrier protein] reductase